MANEQVVPYNCPDCGAVIYSIRPDGSRTDDSAPLLQDRYGTHSICPECRRKIQMVRRAHTWIASHLQDEGEQG